MVKGSVVFLGALFLGLFLLSGCQNPVADLTNEEKTVSNVTPMLIELPADPDLAKGLKAESTVKKDVGGKVELKYVKKELNIYMKLEFDPGSVTNDFSASLSTDTKYLTTDLALTFGPHGTTFLKPGKLTLEVSGVDLSAFKNLDTDGDGKVELNMYYTDTTPWEKMKGSIVLDLTKGTIKCTGGELPHFSRYAFGT